MTNEVFGRPVTGDIQETSRSVTEQRDPAEFIAALDKLFEDERILAFRWEQYTPYFNDGDACEFSIDDWSYSVQIKGLEDYEDGYREGFISVEDAYSYNGGRQYYTEIDGVDVSGIFEAVANVPANDYHSVFLRQSFGDHAQITATREGFHVEFYEHD